MTPETRKKTAPLFFLFMLSVALAINLSGEFAKHKTLMLGQPVKNFVITELGKPFKEFSPKVWEGKIAVINIFASWCEPCQAEHEILIKLSKTIKVPIYGIAWKDKEENITRFLDAHGNPYTLVGYDHEGKTTLPFAMTGVPETYIVDPKGLIVFHHSSTLTEDDITDEILPILKHLSAPHATTP